MRPPSVRDRVRGHKVHPAVLLNGQVDPPAGRQGRQSVTGRALRDRPIPAILTRKVSQPVAGSTSVTVAARWWALGFVCIAMFSAVRRTAEGL